jgi:hypothetical protein
MARTAAVLWSGRQHTPVPDMDLPQATSSNFSSDIASETGSTDFVEGLFRAIVPGRGR